MILLRSLVAISMPRMSGSSSSSRMTTLFSSFSCMTPFSRAMPCCARNPSSEDTNLVKCSFACAAKSVIRLLLTREYKKLCSFSVEYMPMCCLCLLNVYI